MPIAVKLKAVLLTADGSPWQRAKILPYGPLCGSAISDYGGKSHHIGQNWAWQIAQKHRYLTTLVKTDHFYDFLFPFNIYRCV